MAISIITAITFVLAAASTAYQIVQAKKMKRAAEKAAEARRGFEMPVEGDATNLALVYGRFKIGGARVWHATASEFKHVTSNADKIFQAGTEGKSGYSISYNYWGAKDGLYDTSIPVAGTVSVGAIDSGYLDSSQVGTKNEYLFFQQALCVGPIGGLYDVIVDESRFLDDPAIGTYGYSESDKKTRIKAAMRIDCHYQGGVADAICAANFGERSDALFDGMAYVSVVVRVDRDDPQFSNVPVIQLLGDGRMVRTVSGGVLGSTRINSNNPAFCLLDYLLDGEVGADVDLSELDLVSFENAAAVCDTVVQTEAPVGGKYYQNTDGTRNITSVNIRLYECNIILDPDKPCRENIEALLSTMGDARLVWSAGKYRLSLAYPTSNAAIPLAETITDDMLVQEQDIEISWPNASERYNFGILRFHNEFENFKEDSVMWPPKYNDSYYKGIGGSRYGLPTESWNEEHAGGRLLNNYGVWEGDSNTVSLQYLFKVDSEQAGTYDIKYTGDNSIEISVFETKRPGGDVSIFHGTHSKKKTVAIGGLTLGAAGQTKFYRVQITATDTGSGKDNKRGAAVKIENTNKILWTTRDPTFSDFILVEYDNSVYSAMLAEDGGIQLETEMFSDGVTDPYHALAKIEEMVRTSRSAFGIKFKYNIVDRYLEPGDFVKLQSETLQVGFPLAELYLRVNSAKIDDDGVCEVDANRFDYTQLAWSLKDGVYVTAAPVYDNRTPAPASLEYFPATDAVTPNSGRLVWEAASGFDVSGYAVYVFDPHTDAIDSAGQPVFREIARTSTTYYTLPPQNAASLLFAVRTVSISGRLSLLTVISFTEATDLVHNWQLRKTPKLKVTDGSMEETEISPAFVTTTIETNPASITLLLTDLESFSAHEIHWYVNGAEIIEAENTTSIVVEPWETTESRTYSALFYHPDDIQEPVVLYVKIDNFFRSLRIAELNLYKWFPATPGFDNRPNLSNTPIGTSVYKWEDDTWTMPATDNGWTREIPEAPSLGMILYRVRKVLKNSSITPTDDVEWTGITNVNTDSIGYSGEAFISLDIPNDNHSLPANSAGVVASGDLTGSGTTIAVLEGSTPLTFNAQSTALPTVPGTYNLNLITTHVTPGALIGSGTITATLQDLTAVQTAPTVMSLVIAARGLTLSGKEFYVTRQLTYTKVKSQKSHKILLTSAVVYKDAVDAATVGTYTSLVISGKRYDGATVDNFGWATVTPNNGSPTARQNLATASWTYTPASNSGMSSFTITLYDDPVAGNVIDTQVVNVVFRGTSGQTVTSLSVYKRSASTPAAPSGGSYDFGTKTLTVPAGWSLIPPAPNGNPLYMATGTAFVTGTSGAAVPTWSSASMILQDAASSTMIFIRQVSQPTTPSASSGTPSGWSATPPGGTDQLWVSYGSRTSPAVNWTWSTATKAEGTSGQSVVTLTMYKRSAAPLTTAPTGGSYDFGTKTLTPVSGWSTTFPDLDGNPLYSVTGTAFVTGTTGNAVPTWSTPTLLIQDPSSVKTIFRRSAMQPSTPAASAGTPSLWSDTPPTADGNPLWVSYGQRASSALNWTWGTATKVEGADGAPGDDGRSVAEISIYRRSAVGLNNPTGGSYNFDTRVLTPPTDWYASIPANDGNPLYTAKGVATVIGSSGSVTPTWSGVALMLQDAESVDAVFKRATNQPTTPASSASVPTLEGWSSTPPAGTDPLWVSYGTRTSAVGNWTWSLPFRADGVAALTASLSNDPVNVAADYKGVVKTYSNTPTLLQVFEGTKQLDYDGIGTNSGTWKVLSVSAVGITQGTMSSTGSSPNRSANFGNASAMATDAASVTYTIQGTNTMGAPFTIKKTQTFVKALDAAPNVRIELTNDNMTLTGDTSGNTLSYVGSGTRVYAYEGDTQLDYDGLGGANGTFKVTASGSGISPNGTPTLGGSSPNRYADYGVASGMAAGTATATISFTVTGKTKAGVAFSQVAVQSFNKVNNGTPGSTVTVNQIVTSSPVIVKAAADAATSGTHTSVTVQGKQFVGDAAPVNYGYVTITANGDTEAATATNTASGPVTLAPADSAGKTSYTIRLYNQATVSGATLLDTEVVSVVFKGANATRTAELKMYQWNATKPASHPSGTSSYTWTTGLFTAPATANSWTLDPGTGLPGQKLWMVRQVYTDVLTNSPSSVTWSAADCVEIGAQGSTGLRTATLRMYQWSIGAPTSFPAGTSTYTWATGLFTAPATANSWTLEPGTGSPGQKLWVVQQVYTNNTTTTADTVTWSASTCYSIGSAGSDGSRGSRTFYRDISAQSPNSSWSDAQADAAVSAAGLTKVSQDMVTLYNTATGFSATRFWAGPPTASWVSVTQVLDGNLLVLGTVAAQALILDDVTLESDGAGNLRIKANGVNTPQLASNAVTQMIAATSTTSVGVYESATPPTITVQQATITGTGGPISLDFCFNLMCLSKAGSPSIAKGSVVWSLLRGTTAVASHTQDFLMQGAGNSYGHYQTLSGCVNDSPGAGTFTYYLKVMIFSDDLDYIETRSVRFMKLTELKR